ncbi:MAG: radical SAM/SPASM domain-containing protein [Bacillota bacterium]
MKRFKKVYIEITNICNLSCNFCPKTKREQRFIDVSSFEHVINEVKPYTDHVYFHLMGEPLLNPHIRKLLEICHENQLYVNITTNGVLLEKLKDVLIASQSLRQLNISLGSFEANNKYGDLEGYIDSIADFIKEAAAKSSIICSMRLWNLDSAELKGSNEANKDIMRLLETKLELDFQISEKLKESNRIKLKDNVYLNLDKKFNWPDINKVKTEDKVFCYGLRDQIGILVDGTVVPCCLDSEGNIPLGNIFRTSLEEILASERVKKIYEGFSKRHAVEELCRKCGYAERYSINQRS